MNKRRKKVDLPDNLRGILARNLETVMTKVPALDSQPKIAAKGKIAQSSVGRVFRAEVAVNLDNLEAIAKAASLDPWQLLVPNLDPLKKPKLVEAAASTPAAATVLYSSKRRNKTMA